MRAFHIPGGVVSWGFYGAAEQVRGAEDTLCVGYDLGQINVFTSF
jgi:hypothetical protein